MKRVLLFAALIAWSGLASAVVYKWTDAQGKLQYGDRPPDGVHAEVVEMLGSHASSGARAASTSPAAVPARTTVAANVSPKDSDDKKSVDEDVAQVREKQCTDAQDRYKKLIEGRRIYKTGPDGERQYMSSEEIDTERLNAKRDIDTICNSST
jgi:acetylornithine deacetylase/succinyl-diaminopimelate desuccinylase-like protein